MSMDFYADCGNVNDTNNVHIYKIKLENAQDQFNAKLEKNFNLPFPKKLLGMIQEAERIGSKSSIRWKNNGTAIKVCDRDILHQHILPMFNRKPIKFVTLQRMLQDHNFKRLGRGKENPGVYANPLFVRDKPELLHKIKDKGRLRTKNSTNNSKIASTPGTASSSSKSKSSAVVVTASATHTTSRTNRQRTTPKTSSTGVPSKKISPPSRITATPKTLESSATAVPVVMTKRETMTTPRTTSAGLPFNKSPLLSSISTTVQKPRSSVTAAATTTSSSNSSRQIATSKVTTSAAQSSLVVSPPNALKRQDGDKVQELEQVSDIPSPLSSTKKKRFMSSKDIKDSNRKYLSTEETADDEQQQERPTKRPRMMRITGGRVGAVVQTSLAPATLGTASSTKNDESSSTVAHSTSAIKRKHHKDNEKDEGSKLVSPKISSVSSMATTIATLSDKEKEAKVGQLEKRRSMFIGMIKQRREEHREYDLTNGGDDGTAGRVITKLRTMIDNIDMELIDLV